MLLLIGWVLLWHAMLRVCLWLLRLRGLADGHCIRSLALPLPLFLLRTLHGVDWHRAGQTERNSIC